jgi:hypothetical protein
MLEKCLGQLTTQAYVSTNTAAEQKPVKPHDKFKQPPSPSAGGALQAISPGIKRLESDTDHSFPPRG